MIHDQSNGRIPAPCIIDTGILVNKRDMLRLLEDLSRVHYIYWQDGNLKSQGDGCVMEVFTDPQRSTLIANHAIYINVSSFDYLEIKQFPDSSSYFDLIHEGLRVRLIPLSNPLQQQTSRNLDPAAIEAVVAEILSAKLDAEIDDDGLLPF